MLSSRATTAVVAVVTAMWVVNVVAGIAVAEYDPSGVNLIFGAVVSGVLVYRQSGNGSRPGPKRPSEGDGDG